MSRCVLLPALGDPLLTRLWIRQYKPVTSAVDNLYVIVDSSLPNYVRDYALDQYIEELGARIINNYDHSISHGQALRELFDNSKESFVMLIEDDCFIFKGEMVDRYFRGLEKGEYDLAGSPRGSCAKELWDVAEKRWELDYSGARDVGPAFWPNCLFAKRSDLEKTDLYFDSREFVQGEYIKYLDHTMQETGYSDTMVSLSLQLRDLNLRIKEIPQYHGSLYELQHYESREGLWDGYAPWTHTGSSSSIQYTILNKTYPKIETTQEKYEYERRFAWWLLAYDLFSNDIDSTNVLAYIDSGYKHILDVIKVSGLSYKNIKTLIRGYKDLIK